MFGYRVQNAAQGIIGPVKLETLRALSESGVITRDMLVSRGGGPFMPASSFPEVLVVLGQPGVQTEPTYSGDVRILSFFKIFHRLFDHQAAGLLVVRDGTHRRDVYLEKGQPVFVSSTALKDRFGEWLVGRGRITEAQQRATITNQGAKTYGETLVSLGILKQDVVMRELHEQQVSRLVDLCLWEEGQYAFYDGVRYSGTRVELDLKTPDLVVRAARQVSERIVVARLGQHLHQVARRETSRIVEHCAKEFNDAESAAAARLDSQQTVVKLIAVGAGRSLERRAMLSVLYLLWEVGGLSFVPRPSS
jgi:hypothetical protein